jgi:adenylate cyclase
MPVLYCLGDTDVPDRAKVEEGLPKMTQMDAVPDRNELQRLLRAYNEQPGERDTVFAEIERRFRRDVAVLVLDTCGFSRTVRAMGVVHFLALLERLERVVRPIVERSGGRVLRTEADNVYAVFPDAAGATGCAAAILQSLDVANEALPAPDEFYVSIGIGFGGMLMVGTDDMYGDEMNLACKLGEDLARQQEILLTPSAHAALGPSSWQFEQLSYSVSGIDVTAYRLLR